MKKWQNMASKFLVAVLLSANLVSLAPTLIEAAEESRSITEEAIKAESGNNQESSENLTLTGGNQAVTKGSELTKSTHEQKETSESSSESLTVPVQMLGVNDFHGAIDTKGSAYLEGVSTPDTGRAVNLAAHLDEAQRNFQASHGNGGTERIQAGDLVGGSPANSALLQDEPTMRIFNQMQFGIGTLGNHEFDEGLAEFKRILDGVAPEPGQFNPIVDTYPREKSSMEIVIANVELKTGGIPEDFEPYTIRTYGSGDKQVKVGYIGIITTEFTNLVLKQHHEEFNVLDEAETIVKYAKELREQGVNAIAVVSHLAATSKAGVPAGEAVEVMNKVNAQDPANSVDVVFAAHNHQYTNGVMKSGDPEANDIRIVQSTSNGKAYIDLQGEIDVKTGDFIETPKADVKPVTARTDQNQAIAAIVKEADETIKAVTTAKVGTADQVATNAGKISRDNSADSESPLGNLITDAQLFMANQAGLVDSAGRPVKADFALTNNGGIRADLTVNENGDITWGAAQAVQPFGNILQVVKLSGKDLKGALNEQHANGKAHYFLQMSGLTMTYTKIEGAFSIKKVTDDQGNEIRDDYFYNVIINDFLFGGGDGFSSFTKGELVAAMDTDTNTFVDYFEEMEKAGKEIITPNVGRKKMEVENVIPIQLLGVNDFHGAIDTTGTAYIEGVGTPKTGLAANLAAHLDEAQGAFNMASGGYTERIQAGDLVGASPASSALLQDEPTIKIFNMMNFSIGTIGNHEFDEGLGEFRRILDGTAPVPGQFHSIVDNYPREKSKMEVVLANVVNKVDGLHGKKGEVPHEFKPYTLKTYGKGEKTVKVGYIGIVTSEFPNLVLKKHHEDYQVLDEAETIVKYSKELREKGVNAIVVVSHLAATSAKEVVAGEVANVMGKVDHLDPDNSVDVVFAAHNHQYTNGVINGSKSDVRVVQSTSQGKAYIDLQGELDTETKDFVEVPKAVVKATTDRDDKNQAIAKVVAEAQEIIKPVTSAKVGLADQQVTKAGLISREITSDSESPLGNLITDAQLFMANQAELKDDNGKTIRADFALTNNGGIRDDLKVNDIGEITWGAAQNVQPFGNILQVVAISGKDLKGALNEQHANGKTHYFLQVSGLKMSYSQENNEFKVVDVTDAQGKSIEDTETYTIIINDFLLGGGDGFTSFTKGKLITAMDTDTDTFIDYFKLMEKDGKTISSPETGRKFLAEVGGTTEEELRAASTVSEIKAGEAIITGKTLAGTTVTYDEKSVDADETGSYSLAAKKAFKEQETVSVEFTKDKSKVVVDVTIKAAEVVPPITKEELSAASMINDIKADDQYITGKTLVGTTVSYSMKKAPSLLAMPLATESEVFTLPVTTKLNTGDILEVLFKNGDVSVVKEVVVDLLKALETVSTVNPIMVGDSIITGKTLAGATVTYDKQSVVADETGSYLLTAGKDFKEQEKVSVEFSKDKVKVVVETTVVTEKVLVTLEALVEASSIDPINAGDKEIKGHSIVGTTVTYVVSPKTEQAKEIKTSSVTTGKDGHYIFADIPETLKAGDKVIATFTNGGLKTTVERLVTEKNEAKPVVGGTVGNNKPSVTTKGRLPQMGGAESLLSTIGLVVIVGGYLVQLKKRHKNENNHLR